MLGVGGAAALLLVGTHVDDLNVRYVQFQPVGDTVQAVGIPQQDRYADAFLLCLYGRFHHRLVTTLCKDDALRMVGCGGVEGAGQLGFLSQQLPEVLLVALEVLDRRACHAALHGGLGHRRTDLGDQPRVDRFRNEVLRSEGEVVHAIYLVDDIGHGLLGKVGNGFYGGHLHLLVDGFGMDIQCAAEDVGESDDVVDLVGVVGTACRHDDVRPCGNGVLVGYFRDRIGQCEDDRLLVHRADHVLREDVALGQSDENVSPLDGFLQRVDVAAVGGEECLLRRQLLPVRGDDPLGVEHQDVLLLQSQCHVQLGA